MLAWTWSPSISPLGVGLDLIPPGAGTPLGPDPPLPRSMHPPGPDPPWEQAPLPPWTEWQTGAKILPCPKLRLRAVIMRSEVHSNCFWILGDSCDIDGFCQTVKCFLKKTYFLTSVCGSCYLHQFKHRLTYRMAAKDLCHHPNAM